MTLTKEEAHQYWRQRPQTGENAPVVYAEANPARSRFLVELIQQYVPDKEAATLELGCNVGRNLWYLQEAGYTNLTGMDINVAAIELGGVFFPDLQVTRYAESLESFLVDQPDNSFATVFSMAVLEHIHPDSAFIFGHLTRVCGETLITIEDESTRSPRHWPRNYKQVFDVLGWQQVKAVNPLGLGDRQINAGFWARVFRRS